MRFEMKMPDLATTDSAIRIGRWMIEPGGEVKRGESILEVETDKAAMEVESVVTGTLVEVLAQEDDEVSVGDVIAVLEVEGSSTATPAAPAPAPAAATPTQDSAPAPTAEPTAEAPGRSMGMFARRRGDEAPASDAGEIRLSVAQRTAANRLQQSKQTIPHFYLQVQINAGAMAAYREAADSPKPAWDAFFVRAVARALGRFDRLGCRLEGDRLVPPATTGIGVAIDHEGELYVIPVEEPADKTIEQITAEIRQNVERLRSGDPDARMIRPAAMTISNLGVCNVDSFIPIINPPETAILGIGKVAPTPVAGADGTVRVEPRCTLTLSVDHRVASGRYAAEFLEAVVAELETIS